MHRDQNVAARQAGSPAEEPERAPAPAIADPAGAAALPAERWVMATDQTAMLPLIRTPKGWGWLLALCLPLVGAGVVAYAAQMIDGLGVTGMSNRTPWSFYIVNFVFFIGASAGGIVVAALAYALKLERFKPVARLAEITALTCLTLASIFITLDVGRPDRLWHLVRYGNLTSPLVWDVTSITIYGVLAFALVYFSLRSDLVRLTATMPRRRAFYRLLALGRTELTPEAVAKDKKILRTLALLSVPAAVAVHTVTAWILGLVKAQEGWNTAIIAPMFIVSAVVSGVALTIVAAIVSRWALGVRIGEDVVRSLARILFLALPVLGYLLVSELVTGVYPGKPGALHVFSEMTFGRWGFVFWLALAAFVVAFALLGVAKKLSLAAIGFAALLVVVAVLAERWNIVLPSLTGASHLPYAMPGYTPSAVELVIAVAAYAGGVLAYVVLSRLLPMVDLSVEREAHQ